MWHFRSLRVGFLPLMTFLLWAAVRETPFHSGRCSLCKIRDAWDAGSRCAAFCRNGDRSHSTSLPDANSFQAPSTAALARRLLPLSSGMMRTRKLQPSLYDSLTEQRSPLPQMVFHGCRVCFNNRYVPVKKYNIISQNRGAKRIYQIIQYYCLH